jgi:hypothetical protein
MPAWVDEVARPALQLLSGSKDMAGSVIVVDTGSILRAVRCAQSKIDQVGLILYNLYSGRNVDKLISTGNLLSIDPLVIAPGTSSKSFTNLADLRWDYISCEVAYLWRDSQWLVSVRSEGPTEGTYMPLEKALRKGKVVL